MPILKITVRLWRCQWSRACDIDIDYLSLSGGTVDSTSAERAASSAVITNPF